MAVDQEKLDRWFRQPQLRKEQLERQKQIRVAARRLCDIIIENTPVCADQSHAVRRVREAVSAANDSIATGGI